MSPSDVRLEPARPEHVDFWMALREEPAARRYVDTDEDTREDLLRRIAEASPLEDPHAKGYRWFVECDGRLAGTVSARDVSRGRAGRRLATCCPRPSTAAGWARARWG
jgi:ribosomal-protein-alanine N-acetyltransferase